MYLRSDTCSSHLCETNTSTHKRAGEDYKTFPVSGQIKNVQRCMLCYLKPVCKKQEAQCDHKVRQFNSNQVTFICIVIIQYRFLHW